MAKSELLKEAVADAKALKESALANAKLALEEAFTPKLQSMISAKLSEEMDDEYEDDMEDETLEDGMYEDDMGDEEEFEAEPEMEAEPEAELEAEPEMEVEDELEDEMGDEEDLELEAVIRELEDEEMGDEMEDEMEETYNEEDEYSDDEEEIDIQEVINSLREFEADEDGTPEEGPAMEEDVAQLRAELEEAYNTIETMKSSINETNLLNAKLLFSNKLFRGHEMNESQKTKVIENFDRAQTVREVKLVYATLSEGLSKISNKTSIKESASRPTPSTAPKKEVIAENNLGDRFAKLAGIIK
jgi:hypothetical protein